jgi:cell wall-associated NlpC family hydrolase
MLPRAHEQLPAWTSDYIGLPFLSKGRSRAGLDCYGLIWLILREQFAIDIPSYDERYDPRLESRAIGQEIEAEKSNPMWLEVGRGFRAAPLARLGDIITLRRGAYEDHVGLVIGLDRMIHIRVDSDSVDECYLLSKNKFRIGGFYRHARLLGAKAGH